MESNYFEDSDLFIQDEVLTAAEWNERVFYLPQDEFNARWKVFSIWLSTPTVSLDGSILSVSDINAIVAGTHFTGTGNVDTYGYSDGSYQLVLTDTGTITIESAVSGYGLAVADFDINMGVVTNINCSSLQTRLFTPWVEVVGDSNDETVVWWVNDGRGGIKRDTNGYMMVSDDGTNWSRLTGNAVSPLTEDNSTFAIRRCNENITGNTRGGKAVDMVYERSIASQVASGDYAGIFSGKSHTVAGLRSAIVGGNENNIAGAYTLTGGGEPYGGNSFIGGGYNNQVLVNHLLCVIAGGASNQITANGGVYAQMHTISGGYNNIISGGAVGNSTAHTIAGGRSNSITGTSDATIGGGQSNVIYDYASFATIGGGYGNHVSASGEYGCIPGGRANTAGAYSFACGYNANGSNMANCFVFADGTTTTVDRAAQFKIGANGGLTLRNNAGTFHWWDNGAGAWLTTPNAGCYLGSDGVWYSASSRQLKNNFVPLNGAEILEKVCGIQIEEWEYNTTPGTKHIGVMAEDFAETFGLGDNPAGLNPLDLCGVLWVAVQQLTQRVVELEEKCNAGFANKG